MKGNEPKIFHYLASENGDGPHFVVLFDTSYILIFEDRDFGNRYYK